MRAEDAQGTPSQSHISPSILFYEAKLIHPGDLTPSRPKSSSSLSVLSSLAISDPTCYAQDEPASVEWQSSEVESFDDSMTDCPTG